LQDWHGKDIVVGLASDHGGYRMMKELIGKLEENGIRTADLGPDNFSQEDDYPIFANNLCRELIAGNITCGVLLCRTGIGMSITANRFPGIRAALALNKAAVKKSRTHNAANILVTGGDDLSTEDVLKLVEEWLQTPFSGEERHARRVRQIDIETYDEIAAVRGTDPEVAGIMDQEKKRQEEGLELIASENFASCAVRAATGSVLTNKYAEGYPGKRYYNGCEVIDELEDLAIKRACDLFGAEAANVQPHSGSQANMAAYMALLDPGDTVLAMSLDHGGHLTHGLKVNFSGMFYNFVEYGVDAETEMLDYENIADLARENKPKLIMAGASAYPRIIDFKRLREIADEVGAYLVVDMAHIAGLVATGVHPNPVPYSDIVTTTTHKTLRGPRGGLILSQEKYIKKLNSRIFPGIQGGPLEHAIAAKAICFKEAMSKDFKDYQKQVVSNAKVLADELAKQGMRIVSGGTENHLMLTDMRGKGLSGKVAAEALDRAAITVNKNLIPYDPEKPTVTSGLRIGTPAVTTRGMKEDEMRQIAEWMGKVLDNEQDSEVIRNVREQIVDFTRAFPMPQIKTFNYS
ncbi:MAG: serine hydroxymethyltransferase, partial [Lentisphaeria bacterium]